MSAAAIGGLGMAAMLIMLALRVPVAFAMFAVGFCGIAALRGLDAALGLLASESFTLASSAELVVVPLFILMGNVATETGMSRKLYDAAYALIGSVRGGLASATIIGLRGLRRPVGLVGRLGADHGQGPLWVRWTASATTRACRRARSRRAARWGS